MNVKIVYYFIYPSGTPFLATADEFKEKLERTEHIKDEISVHVTYRNHLLKITLSLNVY